MINRRYFLGHVVTWLSFGAALAAIPSVASRRSDLGLSQPPEDNAWDWWRSRNRTLLTESEDPVVAALILAASARKTLWIIYDGGTTPGETRKISPLGVFTVEGFAGIYTEAICHTRSTRRTFRVERISSLS